MKIIVLGGNSIKNHGWVQAVAKQATHSGNEPYPHAYEHWNNGAPFIDLDLELNTLRRSEALSGEYVVIAKSMGCILALKGIHQRVLQPTACLFLGFPLAVVQKESLPVQDWIANLSQRAVFVQNDHDPLGSYDAVRTYLTRCGIQDSDIIAWAGDTHDYAGLEAIVTLSASLAANQARH